MEIKLSIRGEDMPVAQLQTLMKILAHQKALISLMCDKNSKTVEESDDLYKSVMSEADEYYQKVYEDLFAKYSIVDPKDILPDR